MPDVTRHDAPRDRILAIFDVLGEQTAAPSYRGCAFINASAEGPRGETKVTRTCSDSRAWLRDLFIELARSAGAADPAELGRRLVLLFDGATIGASMDHDPAAAATARALAAELLDRQLDPPSAQRRDPRPAVRPPRPASKRPAGGDPRSNR